MPSNTTSKVLETAHRSHGPVVLKGGEVLGREWEEVAAEYNRRNPDKPLSTVAVRSIHRRALAKLRLQLAELADLIQ